MPLEERYAKWGSTYPESGYHGTDKGFIWVHYGCENIGKKHPGYSRKNNYSSYAYDRNGSFSNTDSGVIDVSIPRKVTGCSYKQEDIHF